MRRAALPFHGLSLPLIKTLGTDEYYRALKHPSLLGGLPAFKDLSSWGRWIVFMKAVAGVPMLPEEEAVFRLHTGRSRYLPPPGGYPEAVAIVGVQSGKTRIAGAFTDHSALTGEPGTYATLIGQDHRGAMRVLLRYAREPFETLDLFRAEVARSTADVLELRNGVTLAAYPCSPEAVRGIRSCIVVIDEFAFFTATDGRPTDREMLRVARGRLATTGGKLIILSSPYGQSGALWDLYRQHYGRDESPTLIWRATAPEMNPTLPQNYLDRMRDDDPEAYRSEVLGEFRAGVASFLDPDALQACVDVGIRERSRMSGVEYVAGVDPSGGRKDAFTMAIAHHHEGRSILDVVRVWRAPFNPSSVIAEACEVLKAYGITQAQGDRYSGEFAPEQFRSHGITYEPTEKDRSGLYLELLPMVNSDKVRLLDHIDLLREFRGLERRRGASGRDRVDHRTGNHSDDISNSATIALLRAKQADLAPLCFVL